MTLGTGIASGLDTDALLDDPGIRIVVCCGSGGVGKTTTAAALGVRAAERGRRVVVLTIDPARRLAQSMGIDRLDNVPRRVDGIRGDGELHAMMLDMKRTFDETVEAHTDAERARAILENPFYQSLSAGFAGTQEYMAMEKLGQLRARDEWDLIVVDTPPSRSALDFLDAPKRLGSFLDGKFIRLLIAPAKIGGRAGMKFLNVGMSMMTGTLGKLLGGQFLRDVQTFVAAMDSMFGGFRTRADATYQLLQAPGTAFLVVATPERDALREAAYFVERLAAEEMPLAGLVLNRVHGSEAARLSADGALAAAENLEDIGIVDQSSGKAGCGDPAGSAALTSPESAEAPEHHEPHASPEEPDRPESSLSPEPPLPPEYREERPPRGHTARDPQAADPQEHRTPVPPGSAAHTAAGDAVNDGVVNDGVVNDHAADHHTAEEDRPDGAGDPTTPTGPATPAAGIDAPVADIDADADEAVSTAGVSTDLPSDDAVSADVVSVEQLTAGLLRLHAERMQVVARERDTRDRFTALHPEVPVTEVAALPGDVHDLSGLRSVGERLATGAVPSTIGTA
ncbi:ArsA family ATPase [Streptomyces sp. PpalLS-921]|uniref:ArsA family ATPase n=1 Tax=Streptomyces sp. PpalLS-921 TaxID=1839772 RepID=UPI00081EF64E|nr:ArsA family ATPase [Streptomyces sp. PpalLS-921]SCD45235.1 Anion-transporting ATPase, ArsA/GET3 family [Streptomyces sp. PpalLS-921]